MKVSEMNINQRRVYTLCVEACNEYIGGWENARDDAEPDSEEWKQANYMLTQDHDTLVEWILSDVRSTPEWKKLENLHFVTIEWTKERIDKRLSKWGY